MGLTLKNRNKDSYDQERPAFVDDRGRISVNPGLDADLYRLILPPVAVGANKVFFDLFNGSTDKNLEVSAVTPMVDGSVAVVGVLAVDLSLTRTTAVGTGGTAATLEDASLTAATIAKLDPASPALPATITARAAPAGGATAGAVLATNSVFSEETNAATYNRQNFLDMPAGALGARLVTPPNTGIRVVQGTVASVGNIGFDVLFSVVRRA